VNSEEVSDEADLFSLGFTSLNTVPLVLELEEAFAFEFDMDEIQYDNFQTIGDIIKLVSRKVSGSA
jgi:acyl carrier protein